LFLLKKAYLRYMMYLKLKAMRILCLFAFMVSGVCVFSQNNALVLNGAYVVLNGGTQPSPIYLVVNQSNASGITRTVSGGHIISETDYDFVKWNTAAATGSYTYPFGYNTTDYIPFTFNKTAGNVNVAVSTYHTGTTDNLNSSLQLANGVTNMNPSGPTSDASNMVVDRWWRLQMEDGTVAPTGDLTFSYLGAENTISPISCPTDIITAQYWDGTKWVGPGLLPGTGCGNTPGTVYTAQANGVAVFTPSSSQPFILTKKLGILPIELLLFSTKCNDGRVLVNWTTASEQNNNFFTIERSADGTNYLPIGIVNSLGNSSSAQSYSFTDADPLSGTSYYRLRQTDFDGKTEVFSSASLSSCGPGGFNVVIGQNPTEGNIWVSINGADNQNIHVAVTDMLGQNLYTKNITGLTGSYILNTQLQLAGGLYVVSATTADKNFSRKIVVVR
jgi:hypothetical protein